MNIVDRTVRDVISLKIQGASNVRKKSVQAIVEASIKSKAKTEGAFRKEFLKNAEKLFYARPTEPELRTALRILKKTISEKHLSVIEMKERIKSRAEGYEKERKISLDKIAQYGAELIKPNSTIIVHCHSSSVINMLIKAKKKIKQVYCCESRPLYQGRMTVTDLTKAGINATLIVDNAASTILKECDYFFTGTDAFLADGDVINKIGTNQISIACQKYNVRHYAVTSTHKFEPASFFGKAEPIEQRSVDEVWEKKKRGKVKILNPAFDRTDSAQVEGIICELGVFPPQVLAAELYKKFDLAKHNEDFLKF
jgi:eIF-2B alpha/beta/delta-like uncharacterized protein